MGASSPRALYVARFVSARKKGVRLFEHPNEPALTMSRFPVTCAGSGGFHVARVTVEDCLEQVGNRFALVILGAERARQLAKGAPALAQCDNKPAVTALREIARGKVTFRESVKETVNNYLIETRNRTIKPAHQL